MDLNEYYQRAKRAVVAVACFMAAVVLIYRGNNLNEADFSLIVPIMCVMTALSVAATGLALVLRNQSQPE